jgi:hypothetical protein
MVDMSAIKPLEEAPFSEYLEILRKNGHSDDADVSEAFYLELLTGIDLGGGRVLSKEQVYTASFKSILEMAELLLNEISRQTIESILPPSITGPILKGAGADELSPEQVNYLMRKQLQITEQEKARLG